MKKIFLIFSLSFLGLNNDTIAQNTAAKADDDDRISITAYVPKELGDLTPTAQEALKTRLDRIVTKAGLGGSSYSNRFIMTAKIVELDKEVSSTTPVIYFYNLEITLMVGDAIEGTLFSTQVIESKGSGNSQTKAYLDAIKKIKDQDTKYTVFIDKAKTKIIEYFNSKCDFYLKDAQTLTSKGEFEAAIATLFSIPDVCKDCYNKAMDAVGPIYKQQIDRQCKKDLLEASNVWSTNQDYYGAEQASGFLSKIDPNSSCYSEAKVLNDKIAQRIKEIDQRDWAFQLKQQQDDVDIRKAEIKSARDIGVAYGENQPKTITTYKISSWWW
jgi:hypothetical protein